MENILKQLADYAKYRTEEEKKRIPLEEVRRQAENMENDTGFPFEKAIGKHGMSMICEIKRASPSKGMIAPDFPYREIALDYEDAGASAISCLTEPKWFLGNDRYLREISSQVRIPVLRKDFTVDPYMIFRAKILGASAVLLICAILETEQIRSYIQVADSLGLSALVEAHDASEISRAIDAGARIVGVNNRDLRNFTVDIDNSSKLRKLVPKDVLFVSESGIRTAEDVAWLYQNGTDAVLIGETLMRSPDRKAVLRELKSLCQTGNERAG
jgi:indole-3-glycerol phosphate synthase